MGIIRGTLLGALALGFLAAATAGSEAMPIAPLAPAMSQVQETALVCGPFRCFRVFRPFAYRRYYYRRPIVRRFYYRGPFVRRFFF